MFGFGVVAGRPSIWVRRSGSGGVLQSNSKTLWYGYDANRFLAGNGLWFSAVAGIATLEFDGNDMDQVTFDQTYELAEILIKKATKEQLAECARLLALNLAHHQIKHGELPVDQTLALLRTFECNEEHLNILIEGMLNLIGVLMNVCGGAGQSKH